MLFGEHDISFIAICVYSKCYIRGTFHDELLPAVNVRDSSPHLPLGMARLGWKYN